MGDGFGERRCKRVRLRLDWVQVRTGEAGGRMREGERSAKVKGVRWLLGGLLFWASLRRYDLGRRERGGLLKARAEGWRISRCGCEDTG